MTFALYSFYTLCSSGQLTFGKLHTAKNGEIKNFNIWKALTAFLLFLIFAVSRGFDFHLPTMIYGLIYGVFLSASMYFGIKALSAGSIALTNTITSFSLIVPLIYGVAILGEKFTWISMLGTTFLVAAILMVNLKKDSNISGKWIFYALTTMLTNGMCSVFLKQHQKAFTGRYQAEFMLIGTFVVFVFISLIPAVKTKIQRDKISFAPLGILSGVLTSIANFILLYMTATQNASVLFPIIAVVNVIAVCLIGKIIFREKIKPLQIFGIIFGITSILLLNF